MALIFLFTSQLIALRGMKIQKEDFMLSIVISSRRSKLNRLKLLTLEKTSNNSKRNIKDLEIRLLPCKES